MSISRRVLSITCISLSLFALILVGLNTRTTSAAASASAPAPTSLIGAHRAATPRRSLPHSFAPPQQPEKTIGEAEKNVKVLNEFPASQLIPMMNVMSASLGVRCNYCHVNKAGQWDFPSDDKPEKNTAREMIAMTLNINKTTFRGNSEVSCFTCHRGRTGPVGVIMLPLPEQPARPGGPGGPGAGGPATAPQLTPDDILNKYIAAVGGQAAIDKLKTRVMKGTYTSGGNSMNLEISQAAPDKVHVMFVSPQGQMDRGFNGGAGWEKNPRGINDLSGSQLADMKFGFSLFRDLKLKEQFTRMNVRKDKIDGKDVNVIAATNQNGKRERLYFDPETGLLLRRLTTTQTPLGVVPEQTDYEDYRDVDGVKIPFTIRTAGVDNFSTGVRKFTEIKINAPIDDASFNKPSAPAAAQPKP